MTAVSTPVNVRGKANLQDANVGAEKKGSKGSGDNGQKLGI